MAAFINPANGSARVDDDALDSSVRFLLKNSLQKPSMRYEVSDIDTKSFT